MDYYSGASTTNRLRHYHKIAMPKGFIALGDAVCALCPVYGQGITVSALSAIVLQKWLKSQTAKFEYGNLNTTSFQKQLAKSNSSHWALATNQDLKFLTPEGESKSKNLLSKLSEGYINRLMQLANTDPQVYTSFLEVSQLLKSPLELFHPSVVLRMINKI